MGYSGTAGVIVFKRLRDGSTRVRERGAQHHLNTLAHARIRELMRRANACFRDLWPEEMAADLLKGMKASGPKQI